MPDRIIHARGGQSRFTVHTGERTVVVLPSRIDRLRWDRDAVAAGGRATLELWTVFVGEGAPALVTLRAGRHALGPFERCIQGNSLAFDAEVPEGWGGEVVAATVELPEHGLRAAAPPLVVRRRVRIRNVRWSKAHVCEGEQVRLTAQVFGAPEGWPAAVVVRRYDAAWGAHEEVTRFTRSVEGGGIEAEWEATFVEEAAQIVSQAELDAAAEATGEEAGAYAWPAYLFEVHCLGVTGSTLEASETAYGRRSGQTGLLRYQDWVELEGDAGEPYLAHLADGSTREGRLDGEGRARLEKIPPGPVRIDWLEDDLL